MATHTATGCSSTLVQAMFNEASAPGDVFEIASIGSPCHWSTQVTWVPPANATLHCLSTLNAAFNQNNYSSPPNDGAVTIIDDYANSHGILDISGITGTFRMYGCTVEKGNGTVKDSFGLLNIAGTSTQVRFDHNRINLTTGTPVNDNGAKFTGLYGVADHNQIDLSGPGTGNGMKVGGTGEGDAAWAAVTGFGSANFMFFEDNYYPVVGFSGNDHSNPVTGDCDHGGRQVLRFNTIGTTATTGGGAGTQTHPTGGSGPSARGCRASEIYSNVMLGNATHSQSNAIFLSSGSAMIWNNSAVTGYENFITLHSMRKDSFTYSEDATPDGWGFCGPSPRSGTVNVDVTGLIVTKASGSNFDTSWPVSVQNDTTMIFIAGSRYRIASVDSTSQLTLQSSAGFQVGAAYTMGSAWDENATSISGKRCLDQPGNGIGDLLSGTPPSKVNSTTGTIAWPNQALEPVYVFKNTPYGCAGCDHHNFISVYETSVLAANENYYVHVHADDIAGGQTAKGVPFDGTTGTGWGSLARRPDTCTNGVGYGVDDAPTSLGTAAWNNGSSSSSMVMQKCTDGANADPALRWTTYYQPYAYPHPLVGGSVASSTRGRPSPFLMFS